MRVCCAMILCSRSHTEPHRFTSLDRLMWTCRTCWFHVTLPFIFLIFFIFLLHHRHRRFIALLKVLWYNSAASLFTVRCHRLPILCINYRCGAACVIACICARARSTSLHDGWGSTMSWSTLPMRFHHGADDNKEEDAKCECTLYAF